MDLQRLIKHHKQQAEHWRRLRAGPAERLNRDAITLLEAIEQRLFGEPIKERET
jgi:hypothetical protein